ncbi:hypothetical protein HU200_026104 [Digitaria exilis]|uniref:Uncharacterized protein n=1 Tax=Digitaria exilis TaxID=1010633 RepID=A0A835BZ61_9POAL|nr:hypothetical protein HU200_026104 [Digitaria exilis]
MEGIIPFVFKVIAQYKEEGQTSFFGDSMIHDSDEPSPVPSYVLLPDGDSDGRRRHRDEMSQHLCASSVRSESVTTCTTRASPIRCSTLRRRA